MAKKKRIEGAGFDRDGCVPNARLLHRKKRDASRGSPRSPHCANSACSGWQPL